MHDSPLICALRQRLSAPGIRVSEHELLSAMVAQGLLPQTFGAGNFALFQSHFVLFNALYRLSDELATAGLTLEIGLVDIQVRALDPGAGQRVGTSQTGSLRDYYLDWSNFTGASEASVDALLDDFWQTYGRYSNRNQPVADTEKQAALGAFDLAEPVTFAEIKQRYRRLVMREHPDRGGDTATLQTLNDAMAVLALAYGNR